MNVTVIAFATAGDAVGKAPVDVALADGASIDALGAALIERFPQLESIWPRLAVAVDGTIVSGEAARDTVLHDGAEVALLPPVSGGAR